MSELKDTGIGIVLIGIAFALNDILLSFDIVVESSVLLIVQIGIILYSVYFITRGERN